MARPGPVLGSKHKPFTAQDDAELLRRKRRGQSWSRLAAEMGRSKGSLRQRYKRLCNPEAEKEKYRLAAERFRARYPDKGAEYWRNRCRTQAGRFMLLISAARTNSRKRGHSITLSVADVQSLWDQQRGVCYYTGLPMSFEPGQPSVVSLDRLDSSLGYHKGNVVLCCFRVNQMKMADDVATFIEWCRKVITHTDARARTNPTGSE